MDRSSEHVHAFRGWLLSQGYAPGTVKIRLWAVRSLLEHAGAATPAELSVSQVLKWFGSCAPGWRPWSRAKAVESVRIWSRWAGRPELGDALRSQRTPRGVPKPCSEEELAALMAACRSSRDRLWVNLGAYCGLRAAETAAVAGADLSRAPDGSGLLRVVGKGGVVAVVPCPEHVAELIRSRAVLTGRGRLYPRATSQAVQAVVRRVSRRAGVHVTSHQLRHRYGTCFYEASGHDLLLTQQVLRHATPSTTAGYAKVATHRASQVASQLPRITPPTSLEDTRPYLHVVR